MELLCQAAPHLWAPPGRGKATAGLGVGVPSARPRPRRPSLQDEGQRRVSPTVRRSVSLGLPSNPESPETTTLVVNISIMESPFDPVTFLRHRPQTGKGKRASHPPSPRTMVHPPASPTRHGSSHACPLTCPEGSSLRPGCLPHLSNDAACLVPFLPVNLACNEPRQGLQIPVQSRAPGPSAADTVCIWESNSPLRRCPRPGVLPWQPRRGAHNTRRRSRPSSPHQQGSKPRPDTQQCPLPPAPPSSHTHTQDTLVHPRSNPPQTPAGATDQSVFRNARPLDLSSLR